MADPNFKKISLMVEKTTAAATDFIPIVDTLEQVDANKNKKITAQNLRKDITTAEMLDAQVTGGKIAGTTITAANLATDAVETLKIKGANVTYAKIQNVAGLSVLGNSAQAEASVQALAAGTDGHVMRRSGTGIGFGTIKPAGIDGLTTDPNADRIVFWDDGAGSLGYLTAGSGLQISGTSLNAAAISGTEIADDSVDSNHIAAGAIDLEHMSANSIDSDQYVDGSIDRVHLAADIVDGTKIADDSINSEHYAHGSIDTIHIADAQVTNAKLGSDVGVWSDGNASFTYLGGTTDPSMESLTWKYTIIGKTVFFNCHYYLADRGSGNRTGFKITTLPYTVVSGQSFRGSVDDQNDITSAAGQPFWSCSTAVNISCYFVGAMATNSADLYFQGFYEVA